VVNTIVKFMARTRSNRGRTITNGDAAFLSPASLRQPADDLGPRAQRTIARIVEAAREVFLQNGYMGTTVDEIARVAEVSRTSFYTYFPTKREILFAVGAHSATAGTAIISDLNSAGRSRSTLVDWVRDYFEFLGVHGSFAFAWTQAARTDDEIRIAGMKRHLKMCRQFGVALATSANRDATNPEALGLSMVSMLERLWSYARIYPERMSMSDAVEQAAQVIWATSRALPSSR
jgi:AcrR family transcriptional regulator